MLLDWDFHAAQHYYWFPSATVDLDGCVYWAFSRCGIAAGEFPEFRYVDFQGGTFSNLSSAYKVGTNNGPSGRWGDYNGAHLDWGDEFNGSIKTKHWGYGEYGSGTAGWDTHIGVTACTTLPGLMNVTPATGMTFTGFRGGAFTGSSNVYTISNPAGRETSIVYKIDSLPTWLTVDDDYGELASGSSDTATFSTNTAANALAWGRYSDRVNFNTYNNVIVQRAATLVVRGNVPPSSFTVFRGVLEAGGLAELLTSNNAYLQVRNGVTALRTESPITVTFSANWPTTTTDMRFQIENKVSINGLTQRIALQNKNTNVYDVLDTRAAPQADTLVNVDPVTPTDYVYANGDMNARLLVRADGPVFTNTWRSFTDYVNWQMTP